VQMPTADVGSTALEQTSQVSGRFGRIRERRWAGIGSTQHNCERPRMSRLARHQTRGHAGRVRIAYFGLPLAALLLLEDGFEIDVAVLGRIQAPGRRRLTRRLGEGRVQAGGSVSWEELGRRLRGAPPDLVVSWFWTTKLPASVVGIARLGGIGVHPSLLPRHRGPDPYFAAIDQGDSVTGVTAHRIDDEYDTGAILGSREVAVGPDWNAWQLARRLDRPSIALLREVMGRLRAGETIPEKKQNETTASWAPLPSDSDCALSWGWPTSKVLRRVRALAPTPGAFTEIAGQIVTVLEARAATTFPRALFAGEAAVVAGAAVVRTADGAVELVRGEVEGTVLDVGGIASLIAHGGNLVIV
jgi:methionyl-tRNA formyltransferase